MGFPSESIYFFYSFSPSPIYSSGSFKKLYISEFGDIGLELMILDSVKAMTYLATSGTWTLGLNILLLINSSESMSSHTHLHFIPILNRKLCNSLYAFIIQSMFSNDSFNFSRFEYFIISKSHYTSKRPSSRISFMIYSRLIFSLV